MSDALPVQMNMTIPVLMNMAVLAADMNESVTIALMIA